MKILFICTHNRCRSILAEAVTNAFGEGKLVAKSAGSQPAGEVHPLTLKHLQKNGISTDGLRSKSWDEHENWAPDVVVTVCDSARGESCPVWFGKSVKVHWGLTDPSAINGSSEEIAQAFDATIELLKKRIKGLLEKDIHNKSPEEYQLIFKQVEDSNGKF